MHKNFTSDMNRLRYVLMHTCETLCSCITTNPGSAESTRLVYHWPLLHYSIYICYIVCHSTSLILVDSWLTPSLGLHRALSMCGQVYFDIISQGWQVIVLANLASQKYMPQLFPPLTKGITSIPVVFLDTVMPCNINY